MAYLASPAAERITGQVFVVYGGMVALLAAPVVERRFDAAAETWDLPDLDKQLGSFFADRDPSVGFAADARDEHRRPAARLTTHDGQNTTTADEQTGIDMGRLSGKVAIVTGGAQGQGAAIVRGFVAEGAQVVIADIATDEGELLAKELGDDAVFVRHDVTSEADWEATVGTAKERFGRVDVLINNAGILMFAELTATSLEDYERVVRINQFGTFLGMRSVVAVDGGGRRRLDRQHLVDRGPRRDAVPGGVHREQVRHPRHDQGGRDGARPEEDPGQLRAPRHDRHRHDPYPRR